jgi:hypothetical protein
MNLSDKITHTRHLIYEWATDGAALMCSFGKDSMVLLHLARETLEVARPRAAQDEGVLAPSYPLPILYFKHPYFPAKQAFANEVIESWALTVHDYPPFAAGVKVKPDMIELVARYGFGVKSALDLPINTLAPVPRRNFICGLYDWVLRPKAGVITFPWKSVFQGHKSSDVDPFDGPIPLKSDTATIGQTELVFPLRHWTDVDVWDYIEANHVPYDKRRYQRTEDGPARNASHSDAGGGRRTEIADKWLNPDYIHACTACIDPRETRKTVRCPKLGGAPVRNMGAQVLRLQQIPDYIQRTEDRPARNASHLPADATALQAGSDAGGGQRTEKEAAQHGV